MFTFALIVITWNADGSSADAYVMDSGMTGEDCIQAAIDYDPTANAMGWTVSCELEAAQ